MHVFNTEDIAPKNSGNKKNNISDKDVEENAKKIGVEKEKLRKALEDENEYQRLLREIQVKKAEQLKKEKEEAEKMKGKRKIYVDYSGRRFKSVKELCYEIYKGLSYGRDFNGHYGHIEVKGVDAGLYENNKKSGRCNAVWPDGKVAHTLGYSVEYEDIPKGEKPEEEKKEPEKDHNKPVEKPDASNPKPSENPNVSTLEGGASADGGNAPGGGSSGASTAGGSTSAGNSNNSSGSGTGSGNGEGNGENEGDFQGIPKYGEPDWGNLKSDGGFGNFSPSNAFNTGGSCMADIQLDMGEFGNHTLPMSFLCQVLEKLRYVFIAMAYLYSAILVFKTVNSLKG
ncbi:hypothetical protein I7K75_06245 [Neisseria meningitidis]|nr:hypothetical protein [Neisseria meningitidis]MBH5782569.1 hypothetical protein [Neisseria meningitidis]